MMNFIKNKSTDKLQEKIKKENKGIMFTIGDLDDLEKKRQEFLDNNSKNNSKKILLKVSYTIHYTSNDSFNLDNFDTLDNYNYSKKFNKLIDINEIKWFSEEILYIKYRPECLRYIIKKYLQCYGEFSKSNINIVVNKIGY